MREPGADLFHHPANVAIGSDADHFPVTGPRVAPLQDFDRDAADAPFPHLSLAWLVEVDGVDPGEGKPVVIHLIDLARCPDPENRAAWPAGPVGRGTVDLGAAAERGAEGGQVPIADMIALRVGVGCGANLLDGRTAQGGLVPRQGMGAPSQDQESRDEKQEGEVASHESDSSQKKYKNESSPQRRRGAEARRGRWAISGWVFKAVSKRPVSAPLRLCAIHGADCLFRNRHRE